MKLKLDTQDDTTILTVTGPVTADNIPVLKAGLLKFAESGKDQIILDLTAIRERDAETPAVLQELDLMSKWAADHDFDLLVASLVQGLGDVPGPAHAIEIFRSPVADLLLHECALKAEIRRLRDRKAQLEYKLKQLQKEAVTVRALKRENSDMQTVIRNLERQVFKLMEKRGGPPLPQSREMAKARERIIPVLRQLGIVWVQNG